MGSQRVAAAEVAWQRGLPQGLGELSSIGKATEARCTHGAPLRASCLVLKVQCPHRRMEGLPVAATRRVRARGATARVHSPPEWVLGLIQLHVIDDEDEEARHAATTVAVRASRQ